MTKRILARLGVVTAALSLGAVVPALAQQMALEEIVVTARKRQESLQEIPIAITAFSAEQLQRAGVKDLHELSLGVAGLQYHSLGLAIPGRVNPSIRFRGMDTNTQTPTFQLATLFVDGIFVFGNVESIPFDDVERVEVVKGPQAAYFGRSTFGGAINYIMKTPSTKEFSGEVNASAATYSEYNVSASIDGPLVEDKLGVRLGGRFYSKGAMFRASDGGGLGEESSKSVQATLFATPSDSVKIKARVFYARDSDGPAAGGYIAGRTNDTCTGKVITTKAGDTARPVRFICGLVPKQGAAINALGGTKIIDSNTTSRSPQAFLSTGDPDFLLKNLIQKPYPAAIHVPKLNGIGLERALFRFSGSADYDFANGMQATLQGGYNTQQANWARDYTFTPRDNAYSRDPQDMKDHSIEFRLTSAQDQKLRWLGGVNLYKQHLITSGSGGDALYLCVDTLPGQLAFGGCSQNANTALNYAIFDNALGLTDNVKTIGYYGAASYDFTDALSLNLEGRYQDDTYTRGLVVRTTVKQKKFLPRAILQFKPTDATNIYASFSRGVIPSEINQAVIDNDAFAAAQFTAQGVFPTTPTEKMDSYELGWKQQFFDNRISTNMAGYYGIWDGKKSRQIVNIQYTCGGIGAPNGSVGCRPALGEAGPGQPARTAAGGPSIRTVNATIAGNSKIWGFEFESNAVLSEGWTAGLAVDYARNKFTRFSANAASAVWGFTNMKGNSAGRFPKWSGSLNSGYTGKLNADWEWFIRGDVAYFGKTFIDTDNLSICNSYVLTNARAGVEKDNFRLEMFVKNALDDKNWAACARFSEFDLPLDLNFLTQYQGVIVAPQNKRQFGLKTTVKF